MTALKGWQTGRLGELCSIEIGGTPSRSNPAYWDAERETSNVWVSIKDLNQTVITDTAEHISDLGVKNSNVKLQNSGTVLLSFKLSIGRVAFAGVPLYTNEAIAGLNSERVNLNYLFHGLHQWDLLQGVDQAIKGATLNKEKLKQITFEYPSARNEQIKIAEILSTVDRAIEQTEVLITKQQRIKTGLMQDLLTRGIDEYGNLRNEQTHKFKDTPLGRIPMEWEVSTLAQCAERVVVGLALSTTHAYRASGIPLIRNQNIRDGYFDDREMLYLDPNFTAQFPNKATRQGDVLTVRTGANVGSTAKVPDKYVGCPTFTTLITSPRKSQLSSDYLVWHIASHLGQSELNRLLVGGGKENMNVGQFVNLRLLLPPVKEQKRANDCLSAVKEHFEKELAGLIKCLKEKKALMQVLLTGKKRVMSLLEQKEAVS